MKMVKMFVVVSIVLMVMPILSANYYARVIGGYKHLLGRVVTIQGTVENTLGIKDVWHSSRATKNPVIQWYKEQNPPQDGVVYYGADGTDYYCFHERWLKVLPPKEAEPELLRQEEAVIWMSPDGTVFGNKDLVFGDTEKEDDDKEDDLCLLSLNKEDF